MFATLIGPYPDIPDATSEGDRLRAVVEDQLDAGLGMVTDGRVHRVGRMPDRTVEAWRAADAVGHHLAAERGLEPPLVKACLLGPWSAGGGDPVRVRESASRLGPAIEALFEAGAPVVQLTEPGIGAVRASDAVAVDLVAEVLEQLATRSAGVGSAGAGSAGAGHLTLALAGGGPTSVPPDRLMVGFGSYLLDLIAAPDDWNVCARVPGASGLIVGVVDPRAARDGATEVGVWGARYAASMGGRGAARTGVCPGAGIERLGREAARAVLAFAAEVARKADLPDHELVGELDPSAIDARSAALGHATPRPPRGAGER